MKLLRYLFCLTLLFSLGLRLNAEGKKEWTIVVYMVPDGELDDWATENMASMVASQASSDVAVMIQLYKEGPTAERYWLENNKLVPADAYHMTQDTVQDMINAAEFAQREAPANRYGFIAWGHGYGVLNPKYNRELKKWKNEQDVQRECTNGVCPVKSSFDQTEVRGLLNHTQNNTILKTAELETVFAAITKSVGKKLEFIGFDCCEMAMYDVARHLADYTRYIVGSQNCEMPDGWNYSFLGQLAKNPAMSSEELVRTIARLYEEYYRLNTTESVYTLSVIDVVREKSEFTNPELIDFNLKLLVQRLRLLEDQEEMVEMLKRVRENGLSMCGMPQYADFKMFLKNLKNEVTHSALSEEEIQALTLILNNLQKALDKMIIVNITGPAVDQMGGIVVYLPFNHVDSSYRSNIRAIQSPWAEFLKLYGLTVEL